MLIAVTSLRGLWFVPALGVLAGLWLFARGLLAYRVGTRVGTIATSPVRGLAAGEVRVSGTVEPGPTVLVSRLQSARCVYYRARVVEDRGRYTETVLDEVRSVSFRLRDATGAVQVFPRGAQWVLEPRLDERSGLGDEPPTLDPNVGPALEMAPADREAQIARLLTVHGADEPGTSPFEGTVGTGARHYVEERVEPGDVVTIVATALPFGELGDGAGDADRPPLDDPEIAADVASAAASGTVRARAGDAWGNAAIPGFGIGRPTRTPELDPAATPEPAVGTVTGADGAPGAGAARSGGPAPGTGTGTMPEPATDPGELVLASGSTAMTVLAGTPAEAVGREASRFWTGVAGAVLSVASAAALVLVLAAR